MHRVWLLPERGLRSLLALGPWAQGKLPRPHETVKETH